MEPARSGLTHDTSRAAFLRTTGGKTNSENHSPDKEDRTGRTLSKSFGTYVEAR